MTTGRINQVATRARAVCTTVAAFARPTLGLFATHRPGAASLARSTRTIRGARPVAVTWKRHYSPNKLPCVFLTLRLPRCCLPKALRGAATTVLPYLTRLVLTS